MEFASSYVLAGAVLGVVGGVLAVVVLDLNRNK